MLADKRSVPFSPGKVSLKSVNYRRFVAMVINEHSLRIQTMSSIGMVRVSRET